LIETADTVVVGAGVVGGAIAHALAKAGQRVVILEGDSVGSGSSGHGHGVVSLIGKDFRPGPHFELGCVAAEMYPDYVAELMEDSGLDPMYHRLPGLSLAIIDEEERIFREQLELHKDRLELRWIDGDECRRIEPRISGEARGAVLYDHGQVDGYRFSLATAQAVERLGGKVELRKLVGLVREGDRVVGVEHSGGRIACETVVLAMGAWVRQAESWIDWPIPVRPLHGEVLNVRLPGPPLHAFVLTARHGPILQRKDGILLVGSLGGVTMSGMDVDAKHVFDPYDQTPPEFDLAPHEESAKFMIERALRVMPALEQAELVSHLAGVRPLSADRMPIIGVVPSVSGVVLATGHGTKGIHLAPVTARMVAELILHGHDLEGVPAAAFYPTRFKPASEVVA
jgi:glycine/D-amino acid oxidase-like deaminating enzyme